MKKYRVVFTGYVWDKEVSDDPKSCHVTGYRRPLCIYPDYAIRAWRRFLKREYLKNRFYDGKIDIEEVNV